MNKNQKIPIHFALKKVIGQITEYQQIKPQKNQTPLFQYARNTPGMSMISDSTMSTQPKHRKSRLEIYAQQMMERIKRYQCQTTMQFKMERDKYINYYAQILKYIENEFNEGLHIIDNTVGKMQQEFSDLRCQIYTTVNGLDRGQKLKYLDIETKISFLHKFNRIEIDMIQINTPQVSQFKKDFEKYIIKLKDINQIRKEYESLGHSHRICDLNTKETNNNIPITKYQPNDKQSIQNDASQDPLSCNEELGVQVSASAVRKRKYDVGRQNIIKQQDESDDTNSIISDS